MPRVLAYSFFPLVLKSDDAMAMLTLIGLAQSPSSGEAGRYGILVVNRGRVHNIPANHFIRNCKAIPTDYDLPVTSLLMLKPLSSYQSALGKTSPLYDVRIWNEHAGRPDCNSQFRAAAYRAAAAVQIAGND